VNGRHWVAVILVLGAGILLQIPGFGGGMGGDGTTAAGDPALGQMPGESPTTSVLLEVTGLT
jgi:hypothetical protein